MSTVLCDGEIPQFAQDRLRRFGQLTSVPVGTEEVLIEHVRDAVALIARASTPVTARVIAAAPGLKVIGRLGVGTDKVDLDAATRRGIPVVVTPGAGAGAVAEGVLAMMLCLAKRLPQMTAAVRSGDWSFRYRADALDIWGSTVGIVGLGRIGSRVAELAACLGARVVGNDPFIDESATDTTGIVMTDLDQLFAESQFVSLHVPLSAETRGMVNRDVLNRCQSGTILINAGRGPLISSLDDIFAALNEGLLGGVGLDAFDTEPPGVDHPIFRDERVVLTPHALALSRRGRRELVETMCDGVCAVLEGRWPRALANPTLLPAASD